MTNARKRNRSSAKAAGVRFETQTADYLAEHIDDRIERRRLNGSKDRGDIAAVRAHGQRLVVECKNSAAWNPGTWLKEAEAERVNDDALATLVVAKRHGISDPGQQVVLMTMNDFVALVTGHRPEAGKCEQVVNSLPLPSAPDPSECGPQPSQLPSLDTTPNGDPHGNQ